MLQTVLRIWDSMFNEGHKILIRVALTLLMHHQERFLACKSFQQTADLCKEITSDDYVLQCHTFLEARILYVFVIFEEAGSVCRYVAENALVPCP